MDRRAFISGATLGLLMAPLAAEAQQANPYRIGVVFEGGPYYAVIDGLRDGLREFKLEEGTHFVFDIRDGHGDLAASEKAAQDLERENISLIYAVGTTDTAAVKRATARSTAARIPRSKPASSTSTCRCCRPANFLGACRTGSMSGMSSPHGALRVAVASLPPARAQGTGVSLCGVGIASPDRRDHGGMIAQ